MGCKDDVLNSLQFKDSHNALNDAYITKACYEILKTIYLVIYAK